MREVISPWWQDNEGAAGENLTRLVDHLETHFEKRRRADSLYHMALYGDKRAKYREAKGWRGQGLKFNLAKAVVDTAQAEITGMRPKPSFLTQRGDWGQKRRAQAAELTVEAEYDANNVYEQAQRGFLDAAKTGTTGFKVYNSGWRPCIDLLEPGSLIVDPLEARRGKPRCMYEVALVSRDEALGRWGDTEKAIEAIKGASIADPAHWFPWLPIDTQVEQILIIEAYREPDPETWANNRKGRHVIACHRGDSLVDEEWDRPHPYTLYRYDLETSEFWGRGIVENLSDLQRSLNRALLKIEACIDQATNRVWVEEGSRVNTQHIDNVPGAILSYFGAIPQFEAANPVPEQLFRHAEDIIRRGFEQEGVSLLSAMGRKPAGLNSGAAMREHNDIESKRFIAKSQAYERWLGVTLAEKVVDEKRWIAKQPGAKPPPIRAEVRRGRNVTMKTINWSDAELEQDTYGIRVFPASALPSTPAGRIATVEQWIGSGLLSREQGMALLDFPDLEDFTSLTLSTQEIVLFHVEVMLEDGEFFPPEPIQDIEMSIGLAQQAALRAVTDGAPEENVDLVYRYIDDLRAYQERAAQAAAAEQTAAAPPQLSPGEAGQMAIAQA